MHLAYNYIDHCVLIINPRRMRRRVTVVVLCVIPLSVTTLAATYLVCESNLLCYKVPYDVPNA